MNDYPTVEVVEETLVEVVGGIPGADGAPGAPGDGIAYFHFEQPTVANPWIVPHNLGFFPSVGRCEDSAGTVHHPTVVHIDNNNLELHFVGPTDGVADFS